MGARLFARIIASTLMRPVAPAAQFAWAMLPFTEPNLVVFLPKNAGKS